MKKQEFENLELSLYSETLPNGLRVFVIPMPKVNNIYATFSTDYGSMQNEFIPLGEKKMVKVPDGVAHFLEHKVFEQPEGMPEPFAYFSERGNDANANTSKFKTTYLFSGTDFFDDSMNFLLDYVQTPYFTDQNVEKEKGIIAQELKMYEDDPYDQIYDCLIENVFVKNPLKYPIGGTVASIQKITKDILYQCYNTFYHPSNMFVVVSGNVDPEHVIELVKENQAKKHFEKPQAIEIKKVEEPDKVFKEKDAKEMTVSIPKVAIAYKINVTGFKDLPFDKVENYLSIFFSVLFGGTSGFNDELKKEGIIHHNLEVDSLYAYDHILRFILGETEKEEVLFQRIGEQLKNGKVTREAFERKKKVRLSSLIYGSENVYAIADKVMNDLILYKKVILDDEKLIKSLDYDEFLEFIKKVDFSHFATYAINPKK